MRGQDRELGMHRAIHRRDFVNGAAVALGASLLPKWSWALALDAQAAGQGGAADPYPPRRTGLRGSHAGSFELSHQMRDGRALDLGRADHTGETYDLVVGSSSTTTTTSAATPSATSSWSAASCWP